MFAITLGKKSGDVFWANLEITNHARISPGENETNDFTPVRAIKRIPRVQTFKTACSP